MSRAVEVHDQMVSRLYQRYNQLALDKAEADLRLRHATALLSDLQAAWMDLPPNMAQAIGQILANQDGTPRKKESEGRRKSTGGWHWLSFNIEDVFGCTASRSAEPSDSPLKRPPPDLGVAELLQVTPRKASEGCAEAAGGPTCEKNVHHVMLDANVNASPQPSPGALEVGDLLYETPGVAGLIAEIDVLCKALRKDTEQLFEDMNRRIEVLKAESKSQQQCLEDHFRRSTEALNAELSLCKAQLAQLTEPTVPRFSLAKDADLDLCDNDWLWCRKATELRAEVGQAYVGLLEDSLAKRFQVAENQLKMKEREFQQDMSTLWERKLLLATRIRGRMNVAMGDNAAGPGRSKSAEEIEHLKKTLGDIESSAIEPLRELAAARSRDEAEQLKRLRSALADTKSQCKAASAQLGGLAQQCKMELQARVGSANAALLAHNRLSRRHLQAMAFGTWFQQVMSTRLDLAFEREATLEASLERETSAFLERESSLVDPTRLAAIVEVAEAALLLGKRRTDRRLLLLTAFGAWANWRERYTVVSTGYKASSAQVTELSVRLQSTEAAVAFSSTRRLPRQLLLLATLQAWARQLEPRDRGSSFAESSPGSSAASVVSPAAGHLAAAGRLQELKAQMLQLVNSLGNNDGEEIKEI